MPKPVKTEKIHLVHGLGGGPSLESHSISSDENSRAVIAESAVYEDFFLRIVAKQRQELRHLLVIRRIPSAERNAYEANSQRFRLLLFGISLNWIFAA